jgi:hypothetical protein
VQTQNFLIVFNFVNMCISDIRYPGICGIFHNEMAAAARRMVGHIANTAAERLRAKKI